MFKNRKVTLMITLLLLLSLSIPIFANEIEPYGIECTDCNGYIHTSSEIREAWAIQRSGNCCGRTSQHYEYRKLNEWTSRCGGGCGYYRGGTTELQSYCVSQRGGK